MLLKECLPADMRSTPEARSMLFECCNSFLDMLASQSLAVCDEAKAKIIRPMHVVTALEVFLFVAFNLGSRVSGFLPVCWSSPGWWA